MFERPGFTAAQHVAAADKRNHVITKSEEEQSTNLRLVLIRVLQGSVMISLLTGWAEAEDGYNVQEA